MNKNNEEYVLLEIPKYLFEETGIDINKIIQIYADEDKIIIDNPKDLNKEDYEIFER